ncbi:MAG: septum formation protein Maf [Bacteroidetes bacterium]|nr:septum formation protein Maf [Bacteroidota bacterium]
MEKLILASGSPRRRQLLEQAHIDFEVISPDVDETIPPGMDGTDLPAFLAQKKAKAVAEKFPDRDILAADTVVLLGNEILGKPASDYEAKAMLTRLSGQMHRVVTGVCLLLHGKDHVFSVITEVYFRQLSYEQISFYVDHYHPLDKAGAYAIQEYIGMVGIEKIVGDYYNVMGLPVGDVVPMLASI